MPDEHGKSSGRPPEETHHRHGVEDASLTLLNAVTKYLDSTQPHTKTLFIDVSFAFNTVDTNTLLYCLSDLHLNSLLL